MEFSGRSTLFSLVSAFTSCGVNSNCCRDDSPVIAFVFDVDVVEGRLGVKAIFSKVCCASLILTLLISDFSILMCSISSFVCALIC